MKLPRLSKLLLWRVGLGLALLTCATSLYFLWASGASETDSAFGEGRRLLIALDSGKVEGKFVSTQPEIKKPLDPAPETPAPQTPAPESPAAESPVPEAAAQPQAAAAKPAESQEVLAVSEETPDMLEAEENTAMAPSSNPPKEMNPALAEQSQSGPIPAVGKDGTKPWRYYAKPFDRSGSQPMIAIVISGLGQNKSVTNSALRLSENITLSFSPYARNIASWGTSARVAGHETLLDLPMEPAGYPAIDPGPYGLIVGKGLSENERRLEWIMSRFPGYIGFLTPQNETYSGNEEAFRVLLQSLANRGLVLAVGREPYKSEIRALIDASNTATVIADTLIDEELSVAGIQSRLTQLEEMAKKRGWAIGIVQPYPISVEQLRLWSETLADKGIVLAPISAVARLRFS